MKIIEVTKKSKYLNDVKDLYYSAFPKNEQIPFWFMMRQSEKNRSKILAFEEKSSFVGFIYAIIKDDLLYIFFFAVSSNARNEGYGSQILKLLKEEYNDFRIVLCIEEMDEKADNFEMRKRRKNFYVRNGYKDTNFTVTEYGGSYDIFVNGDNIIKNDYVDLIKKMCGPILYVFVKRKLLVSVNKRS